MQRPALNIVPFRNSSDPDLVIKATHTGITFLGTRVTTTITDNITGAVKEVNKFEATGHYGKRYTGSRTCAVDINGGLWENRNMLEKEVRAAWHRFKGIKPSDKGKKKAGKAACNTLLNQSVVETPDVNARSEIIPVAKNFGDENVKKVRAKSYTINRVEVRHRLYNYINTQKGKKRLFFWTVSFPEGTPDPVCHKLFNVWLTQLRRYGMLSEYLWIKERQDGKRASPDKLPTGTLHFHIAIPHYLDAYRANAMMKGTLKTYSKRGDMPGAVCDLRTGKVHYLPCIAHYNGVHIAKHKTTNRPINFAIKKGQKKLAHYLTKYLTKTVDEETGKESDTTYEQLAWHNSRGFSALFTGVTFTISEFIRGGCSEFLNRCRVFPMRFATFIPWLDGPPPKLLRHLYDLNTYIQTVNDERRKKQT